MMNSANLSSQADLNSLYGNWNPMAYLQGQRMLDLGDQFRQQAYQNNEQTIQADQLKNDQSAQMNPLLLAHQGLVNQGQDLGNQGKGISNANAGLDLSNKVSLNEDQMAADRAKLKTMYSDEQLNQISNNVLQAHMKNIQSGDVTKIQETGQLLDFLTGATGSKVADRVQQRNLKEGDWLNSQRNTDADIASRERMNTENIASGKYVRATKGGGGVANIREQVLLGKMSYEKAAAAFYGAAQFEEDPDLKEKYLKLSQDYEQANLAAKSAAGTGKIDVGAATGMPTVPTKPALGTQPKPGTAENPIVLK